MQLTAINCGHSTIATEFRQQLETHGQSCLFLGFDHWIQDNQCGPSVLLIGPQPYPKNEILARLHEQPAPRVLIIFNRDTDRSDEAIAGSCSDFIAWPCGSPELKLRLQRFVPEYQTENAPARGKDVLLPGLVGRSPEFTRAMVLLRKISASDASVLIEGETGTGKEMAARALHYLGPRKHYPFIPVNCGALPDDLIENELFGHKRGAYTGAQDSQAGLVEQAAGGTLFLDEIGTLSLKAQSSLLRFLQNQEFKRLGDARVQQANIRVVSATNVSLEGQIGRGEFRSDLLYRINTLSLKLPSLRERSDDIPLLANTFLERMQSRYGGQRRFFSASALKWLKYYRWPGNIREMENLIHREFLLAEDGALELGPPSTGVSSNMAELQALDGSFKQSKAAAIEHFERSYLETLMARSSGNVSLASRLAGKERRSLGRLLKKHGITKQEIG